MFYPPGAHSIDIQVRERPRSLLFTQCRYDHASQNTTDFLNQRKALLCMVTQDANQHVHSVDSVPSDFKNYNAMNIQVHVAKKGAVMQAIRQ